MKILYGTLLGNKDAIVWGFLKNTLDSPPE